MHLEALNRALPTEAEDLFSRCCGCRAWAAAMAAGRPYDHLAAVHAAADALWAAQDEAGRLEAFAAHPRIGDVDSLRAKYQDTKAWASGEQASVAAADETVLLALAEGNRAYEKKFGFIFIVCATGKSAAEMLALLQARLPRTRTEELDAAAAEQIKITHLRLDKWLHP
jgi:2-oxo-4-hydroxy-4-carboxy-5-ureidoimidazoline decarboxylase